jgi:hypothetical protein
MSEHRVLLARNPHAVTMPGVEDHVTQQTQMQRIQTELPARMRTRAFSVACRSGANGEAQLIVAGLRSVSVAELQRELHRILHHAPDMSVDALVLRIPFRAERVRRSALWWARVAVPVAAVATSAVALALWLV